MDCTYKSPSYPARILTVLSFNVIWFWTNISNRLVQNSQLDILFSDYEDLHFHIYQFFLFFNYFYFGFVFKLYSVDVELSFWI